MIQEAGPHHRLICGCLDLGLSSPCKKYISVVYKLLSLWYLVIAA